MAPTRIVADGALQRAKRQDCPQTGATVRRNPAVPQKPDEGHKKNHADDAADDTVRPLPPIDGLKIRETHSRIELPVLRNRLIFLKFRLPLRFVQRRQRTRHRLPFGDRQPRFRQSRRAANQDHGEDQRGDNVKPEPDRTAMIQIVPTQSLNSRHHVLVAGARTI